MQFHRESPGKDFPAILSATMLLFLHVPTAAQTESTMESQPPRREGTLGYLLESTEAIKIGYWIISPYLLHWLISVDSWPIFSEGQPQTAPILEIRHSGINVSLGVRWSGFEAQLFWPCQSHWPSIKPRPLLSFNPPIVQWAGSGRWYPNLFQHLIGYILNWFHFN